MTMRDPIRLADAAPFRLGALRFDPPTRQLWHDRDGRTLEPRVMQVLCLLVQAHGRVVGREELVERCWDRRVVSDQAVNRVLAIVRKIVAEAGAPVALETITKVGYRLHLAEPAAAAEGAEEVPLPGRGPALPFRLGRRAAIGGLVGLGVAGAAALAWRRHPVHPPLPPAAQQLITRGMDELDQGLPGSDQQMVAYLRRATELASSSPESWGALALGYAICSDFTDRASYQTSQEWTRGAAERTRELDPDSMDARVALVRVHPFFRRWGAYEAQCRSLLAEAPDHPVLLGSLGLCLCNTGRWHEALLSLERWAALEPDRLSPGMAAALADWHAGRLTEAEARFTELVRQFPSHRQLQSAQLSFLVHTGQVVEAETAARHMRAEGRIPPLFPLDPILTAARAIAAGDAEAKADAAAAIRALPPEQMQFPPRIAYLTRLGAIDDVFALLADHLFGGSAPWAADFRPIWPLQRYTDVLFAQPMAALRRDARFPAVTRAVGLDRYWQQADAGPDYRG